MSSKLNPDEVLEFVDAVRQGFQRAQRAAGSVDWYARLGGRTVRLRAAGPALLERLTPALEHRRIEPSEHPDATLHLWDNRSTGTQLPVMLRQYLDYVHHFCFYALDPRHQLSDFSNDRIRSVYRLGPVDILSVFDSQESEGFYWMDDCAALPYWEVASPLQTLLNWWAESQELQYVHAAAVGRADGAVLLTGPSGSGKSSTALACLDSNLGYLADDYCLLGLQPQPWAYSLYNTAKLVGAQDFERFPRLASWVENSERADTDKAVLNLARHCPEKLLEDAPIKAIVLPTVRDAEDSSLHRVSAVEALRALAPTTMFQLSGTNQSSFRRMSSFVRQVPCYRLDLGRAIERLPALLESLLV